MINFVKKPIGIISVIALISLIAGGYAYFGREGKPAVDVAVAKRGDLIQEVSVTGRVKPAETIDLAFEKSGKIAQVYARVGDRASAGAALVTLENSELSAELLKAEAGVESAKAELLRREVLLENAAENIVDKLQDAYTKADDAVRNKADQFFSNPRSPNPRLNFSPIDSQLKTNLEWERFLVEQTLEKWKSHLDELTARGNPAPAIGEAKQNLNQVKRFLDGAGLAVNSAAPSASLTQATIDAWKSDVSTARSNVNTAIANLTAAEEKLRTAEADIPPQQAKIKEAEANAASHRVQLAKTVLRAPASGLITRQDAKVGEIVSANTPIVSLISAVEFEVEANVPEADIAKVKVGNTAKATLDAYGSDAVFALEVVAIDPAETVIDGVATYRVTFQFLGKDERIKSGMTANVDIATERRENVITIPQRAVITKNGDKVVRLLDGEVEREVRVRIGLRGSDGSIEIVEGVSEGDRVVISFE